MTKFSNLDVELQRMIKLVLRNKPIVKNMCHHNSTYLSLLIDGVEKVDGFFTEKSDDDGSFEKLCQLSNGMWIVRLSEDGKKEYNWDNTILNDDMVWIWDEENGVEYHYHSWNKYGDKHFDMTLKVEWKHRKNDWLGYQYFDIQQPPPTELIDIFLNVTDTHQLLQTPKSWVKNVGVLDKKVYDMMGCLQKESNPNSPLIDTTYYVKRKDSSNKVTHLHPLDLIHQQNYLGMNETNENQIRYVIK